MQPHIFLSYSRNEVRLMRRVGDDLRASGLSIWAEECLVEGTPLWDNTTEREMLAAGCVVVLLTPNAAKSTAIQQELALAEVHHKIIFPVLAAGDAEMPVPSQVPRIDWVDIRTGKYAEGMHELVDMLYVHLGLTDNPDFQFHTPSAPQIYKGTVFYTEPLRPLSVRNPLDQVRLFWWMFMRPERLAAYQEQYWDDSAEKVQYALASTLIWLPFLIARLATSFNPIPNALYTQAVFSPLEWGGILIGLWLTTWWLGQRQFERGDQFRVSLLLFFQVLPAIMVMPLILTANLWYSGIVLIVLAVLFGVSGGVARRIKGKQGFVSAWFGAMLVTAVNPLAIVGGLYLVIGAPYAVDVVLDDALKTRYSSEFSRLFFRLFLLARAALIWLYGFGGRPVFIK